MGLIERLAERFRARRETEHAAYWRLIERAAAGGGEPNEKQLAAIETAAHAIGRRPTDVERDIELLEEFAALGDAEGDARRATDDASKLRSSATAKRVRADELLRQADALRKDADAETGRAGALNGHAENVRREAVRISRQLAAAGRPADVDVAADADRRREIESLQNELRSRLSGMRTSTLSEAEIRARLAELGAAVPETPAPAVLAAEQQQDRLAAAEREFAQQDEAARRQMPRASSSGVGFGEDIGTRRGASNNGQEVGNAR